MGKLTIRGKLLVAKIVALLFSVALVVAFFLPVFTVKTTEDFFGVELHCSISVSMFDMMIGDYETGVRIKEADELGITPEEQEALFGTVNFYQFATGKDEMEQTERFMLIFIPIIMVVVVIFPAFSSSGKKRMSEQFLEKRVVFSHLHIYDTIQFALALFCLGSTVATWMVFNFYKIDKLFNPEMVISEPPHTVSALFAWIVVGVGGIVAPTIVNAITMSAEKDIRKSGEDFDPATIDTMPFVEHKYL